MTGEHPDKNIPIVVDLDGTLINTDLLYEGIVMLIRKNPLYIFSCLHWMSKGKLYFKKRVFEKIQIRHELLPCNDELMKFLQTESSNGRKLVLATASLKTDADEIAKLYPIFNEVYGTEDINLKGINKANLLVEKYGESKFDYIGNSFSDIKIFASSRYAYLVNPSASLERKTKKVSELKHSWKSGGSKIKDFIKAIRAYQWIKNLLIFIPLITSHSFKSYNLILQDIGAFFAFSFVASSGYIVNDLLDLNSDRSHPRKRFRPLASGRLSILTGAVLPFILLPAGLFIGSLLNFNFLIILIVYCIVSYSYSLYFKQIVLYDVFILALLYSTRIVAGGLVTDIPISFWLIAFSTFIFLSLAIVKRYSELMKITDDAGLKNRGRGYTPQDLTLLQIMGVASGFLSVVVFSLYIDSPEVSRLYSNPKILWSVSLLFLFWISRIWVITNRGGMTDDPIVFTIKDKNSYFIFLLIAIILWISM